MRTRVSSKLLAAMAWMAPGLYLLAGWQLAAWGLGPSRLPGPLATAVLFVESAFSDPIILTQGGGAFGFAPHVLSTLLHTSAGLLIGVAGGSVVAISCSGNRIALTLADSIVELTRTIPPLIFVPFVALLFGSSSAVETVSVALYAGPATAIYTLNALRRIPPDLLALGRLLGAAGWRLTTSVQIPAVLPEVIGALRVIFSLGLGVAIVAEFLAAPSGIGRVMKFAISYARVDLIVVGVVWAVVCTVLFDLLVLWVSKRLFRWCSPNLS